MDQYDRQLMQYLSGYVTDNKQTLIDQNLRKRTRYVSVLLENIYKPHNASAVVRTCDCLGIQDIHLIEEKENYEINPYVVRGAGKWVDVHKYLTGDTENCLKELKGQGYRIMATTPHRDGCRPEEVSLDTPLIFAFGNEHAGLSEAVLDMADGYVQIPQVGFTESYNISVTASICLYSAVTRLWSSGKEWGLSPREIEDIRLRWYRECVKNVESHEKQFAKNYSADT
ncbi:MAG: RNA methyltransferase [Cyclobacteriaceae bacterium]